MPNVMENRRGFLTRLAAVVGGLAAVPVLARPAQAGRSHWRGGWGGYGFGGYGRRSWSHRRYWGGYPYGGFGGYPYGGYGGYGFAPRYYNYNGGFYGGGIYRPFQGGIGPYNFYNGGGFYPPMLKLQKAKVMDPLALLDC